MSTEEDTELRDLVIQSLENNGMLAKIKAQLRASVFLSLEEENSVQNKTPFLNKSVKSCLESSDGRLLFLLVREFLEYFNLQHTISVFEPESYLNSVAEYEGREKLIEELNVKPSKDILKGPILMYLLESAKTFSPNEHSKDGFAKCGNSKYTNEKCSNFVEDIENASTHSQSIDDISELTFSNTPKPITAIQTVIRNTNKDDTYIKYDINGDLISLQSDRSIDESVSSKQDDKDIPSNGCSSEETSVHHNDVLCDNTMETKLCISESFLKVNDSSSENSGKFSNVSTQDSVKSKTYITPSERMKSLSNTEKLKPLSSLSSLHDLPPLTLNKTRTDTILLPSLYSKDFKTHRDSLFDLETDSLDNYEEDFMTPNDRDFVQSKTNT